MFNGLPPHSGFVEVLGWVFDIQVLKSVLPSMVTMKFSTAVAFFLSGITLFFVAERARGRASINQAVIPVTTLLVMLILATLPASAFFGLKTGIECLFFSWPGVSSGMALVSAFLFELFGAGLIMLSWVFS